VSYEVIFVNDGSADRSASLLRGQFEFAPTRPAYPVHGNFGQHLAIMAGFEASRGERVVTLTRICRNPPEEIAKLPHQDGRGLRLRRLGAPPRDRTAFGAAHPG